MVGVKVSPALPTRLTSKIVALEAFLSYFSPFFGVLELDPIFGQPSILQAVKARLAPCGLSVDLSATIYTSVRR